MKPCMRAGAGPCTLVVRDHGRRLKTHLFTRYDSAHVVGCHLAKITHSPCMRFLPQLLGNGWGLRVGVETYWRPTVPNPHASPKVRCAVSKICSSSSSSSSRTRQIKECYIIIIRQYLWCCHHGRAIARVYPVVLTYAVSPPVQAAKNYTHHRDLKELRFRHDLTANDTSKTAKIATSALARRISRHTPSYDQQVRHKLTQTRHSHSKQLFHGYSFHSVSTGRVKKLHTLLVSLYFSGR